MLVGEILPADTERVEQIARAGRQELSVAEELGRGWARIWVARETAGAPVLGFLLGWSVADELHVINVATHPDYLRQGVASALLGAALAQAIRDRARLVLLEVRRSNRAAIGLYRAHGFSAMGLRRGYYADNSEDAIEMMLAIDPTTGQILPGRDEIPLAEA